MKKYLFALLSIALSCCAFAAVSGGDSTLSYYATAKADGELLIVSSDTLTFQRPSKFVALGFGRGWLYSQADATPFRTIDVSNFNSSESLIYEYVTGKENRFVYTDQAGVKWLRSTMFTNGNAANTGAGMINWDTGSYLLPGENAFIYNRERVTLQPADVGKKLQLKTNRIRNSKDLDGASWNSCYLKQDYGTLETAVVGEVGSLASRVFFMGNTGLQSNGVTTDLAWSWKINTPDLEDGWQYIYSAKNGPATRIAPRISYAPNYPTGIIKSNAIERPEFFQHQGYVGNNNYGARDIEWLITDIFWQRNGNVFLLADNKNPALATMFVPLVPEAFISDNTWAFKLWKGRMTDYSNAAIIVLNPDLTLLASVTLQ